jgi:hypothetical protein
MVLISGFCIQTESQEELDAFRKAIREERRRGGIQRPAQHILMDVRKALKR